MWFVSTLTEDSTQIPRRVHEILIQTFKTFEITETTRPNHQRNIIACQEEALHTQNESKGTLNGEVRKHAVVRCLRGSWQPSPSQTWTEGQTYESRKRAKSDRYVPLTVEQNNAR